VSEGVTGSVDETVKGVDEATGGVVGQTGVDKTVEETVNGAAGSESVVGGTVDKVGKAVGDTVGGLLGGGK
jgi:hypothetical protein